MNAYKAFYRGKTHYLYAETSYKAQEQAASFFRARKSYEVSIVLCELNGEQVTHLPLF